LRFWEWDIWRFDSDDEQEDIVDIFEKNSSKAGFLSFEKKQEPTEKTEDEFNKFLFQALFYPNVEKRIWRMTKKLLHRMWNFFSVKLESLEVRGTLDDPFYDSIVLGMSGGNYYPDWENADAGWSAKGEMILKTGFFRLLFFWLGVIYEITILAFILWRGVQLAEKNPNGENISGIRKWIFLKTREAV
jgi:hypothetical protein